MLSCQPEQRIANYDVLSPNIWLNAIVRNGHVSRLCIHQYRPDDIVILNPFVVMNGHKLYYRDGLSSKMGSRNRNFEKTLLCDHLLHGIFCFWQDGFWGIKIGQCSTNCVSLYANNNFSNTYSETCFSHLFREIWTDLYFSRYSTTIVSMYFDYGTQESSVRRGALYCK